MILVVTLSLALSSTCDTQLLPVSNAAIKTNLSGDFVVAERGANIEFSYDGKSWQQISLPSTRLGEHAEKNLVKSFWLRSSLVQTSVAEVRHGCTKDLRSPQRLHLQTLAEANDFDANPSQKSLELAIAQLESQLTQTDEPNLKAFITHELANLYRSAGTNLERSKELYQQATKLWLTLDRLQLSQASAFAVYETAMRMSQTVTLVDLETLNSNELPAYFDARIQTLKCRVLYSYSQHQESKRCFADVAIKYEKLGEELDALDSKIDLVHRLSPAEVNSLDTRKMEQLSLRNTHSPLANATRGRYQLMLDYVYRVRGDFQNAIQANLKAQQYFRQSNEESQAWLVSAKRTLATTYVRLGLHEQALQLLQIALQEVDAKSYPARALAVIDQLSQTFAEAGRLQEAIAWQERALKLRSQLKLVSEQAISRQRLQKLDLSRPNYRLFDPVLPQTHQLEERLLEAELLLHAKDAAQAKAKLLMLNSDDLPPAILESQQNLLARALMAEGEDSAAQALIAKYLTRQARVQAQQANSAIAYLEMRRQQTSAKLWVDTLDLQANTISAENLWQMAMMQNAVRQLRPISNQSQTPIAQSTSSFADWVANSEVKSRAAPEPAPTLASMQAHLPADAAVFVLLPGNKQSTGLWIYNNRNQVLALPAATVIQQDIDRLNQWLARKGPMRELEDLIAPFRAWRPEAKAQRLWILADELSLSIPFAVALKDASATQEITYLTGFRVEESRVVPASAKLTLFGPGSIAGSNQQRLDFIDRERRALGDRILQQYIGADATRSALTSILQSPGWTHISAHGDSKRQHFGMAGIWLTDQKNSFVSWLELSQIPIKNQLLVLNACDLASATQAGRQANVSFALAASTAGAKHTIAALWPLSDTASATWVPAFYQGLDQDADNAGMALLQAQRKLANSPHFRHPYYWASLVHFRQLSLPSSEVKK